MPGSTPDQSLILQWIAATAASLGLIVLVVLWLIDFRKKRKALSYAILSDVLLEGPLELLKQETRGFFAGADRKLTLPEGVSDMSVHFIILGIMNTGSVPIERKDYEHDFRLSFGRGSYIVTADVHQKEPPALMAFIKFLSPQIVTLHQVLMNPGNWYTLKVVVHRPDGQPTLSGRISGIRSVNRLSPRSFARKGGSSFQRLLNRTSSSSSTS